jgi:hypothetical protein
MPTGSKLTGTIAFHRKSFASQAILGWDIGPEELPDGDSQFGRVHLIPFSEGSLARLTPVSVPIYEFSLEHPHGFCRRSSDPTTSDSFLIEFSREIFHQSRFPFFPSDKSD